MLLCQLVSLLFFFFSFLDTTWHRRPRMSRRSDATPHKLEWNQPHEIKNSSQQLLPYSTDTFKSFCAGWIKSSNPSFCVTHTHTSRPRARSPGYWTHTTSDATAWSDHHYPLLLGAKQKLKRIVSLSHWWEDRHGSSLTLTFFRLIFFSGLKIGPFFDFDGVR